MNRDDAVARIQQTFGFRTDRNTEIVDALQDAQVILEEGETLPFFLLSEISSVTTTKDEERVKLPTDFLREYESDPLWYFDSAAADADKWTALVKKDLLYLRETYPAGGKPIAYHLDEAYYRIFPTPDDVYTLKHKYFQKDVVLTTNVENLWLKNIPYLMIGEAGQLISPGFRDSKGEATFEKWRERGLRRLFVLNEDRKHNSRRYIMGGID